MNYSIKDLENTCKQIRKDIVEMTYHAGSGHPGGSLSSVELMVVLYFSHMKHDPKNPDWNERDRFFLSKGHACPVLYSILARCGYFNIDELKTLRKLGSNLQGHPNMFKLRGLESSSGSLGQGLSITNGFALSCKLNKKNNRAYCLIGDGELQEGQIWEAAMTAAQHKLSNVCAIIDYNKIQLDGNLKNIKDVHPLIDKWQAFNWNTIEIDGHSISQIEQAYQKVSKCEDKPSVIIAHTIKGKGISFMENEAKWHGKATNDEEYEIALKELS